MKPLKLSEQEWELEFPSVQQYKGQFVYDMQAWEYVVGQFPEDVQYSIEGILYRIEDSEHVDTGLIRQLATIFRGNSREEAGQRIAKWLDFMADFGDFFPEAIDAIIDTHLDWDEEQEEPEER